MKTASQIIDEVFKEAKINPTFHPDLALNIELCHMCIKKSNNQRDEEVRKLVQVLEHIANPIKYMQDHLEPGYTLNGSMAIQMSENANYLKEIAKEAIKPYTK